MGPQLAERQALPDRDAVAHDVEVRVGEVDNALSRREKTADANTPDAFFLGELYSQRLELVESSLPLRMMRRVFLPYADVSERMTNTAGVSNLLPKITRIM